MDERFYKINRLLSQYSLGNFDRKLPISKRLDEVDAFIAGVNMLGEELRSITVSRNYFTNIFNSVSDMVFILDKKGKIENVNKAVWQNLGYSPEDLRDQSFDFFKPVNHTPFFKETLKILNMKTGYVVRNSFLKTAAGKAIPVQITVSFFLDETGKKKSVLLSAKDMTHQLKTENLIIRAIIDTQEKERKRLALDLHDSLGQQLSAIKFFISSLSGAFDNREEKDILEKSNEALSGILIDMRNICFNLMPGTLEEFGLLPAVKELCNKARYGAKIEFEISDRGYASPLQKNVEIDIYRVIQEFISNAMKHGNASKISIDFDYKKKQLHIILSDNGQGFDQSQRSGQGMGLQNVYSRVRSHNGELIIKSEKGKGTKYILLIPLEDNP